MNTFNKVTLAALTALTLGIAAQAEGRPRRTRRPGRWTSEPGADGRGLRQGRRLRHQQGRCPR